MTLRLASYNIHKCLGLDGKRDGGRILAVIAALGADLVALQEVDRRLGARPAALPEKLIEAQGLYHLAPLPRTGPQSLGWHGQAVLLRRGTRVLEAEGIALPGLEPRGALRLVIAHEGAAPFMVIAAHLGLRRGDRRAQWGRLAEMLRASRMPALALGDFNEWAEARGFEALTGLHVHSPGPSYPAPAPLARFDRFVTGPGLRLVRAGVFTSPLAARASDHLPVWADVAGLRR